MNHVMNKQLVKDYKFPVPVVDEPYFSHFAALLEGFYSVEQARQNLAAMSDRAGGFEAALGNTRKLIATVVDHVLDKSAYREFQGMNMDKFRDSRLPEKQVLYHRNNVDQRFIALDMKKANFQALRSVDAELVDGCDSWEAFLGQFTNEPYYLSCKQVRQVIFGQLNPKRQQTVMKHRMATVFKGLINEGVSDSAIFSSSPDEIVIGYTPQNETRVRAFLSTEGEGAGLHIDSFKLEQAHPEKPFFLKRHIDHGKLELKNVPKFYVPEVIRHLKGEPSQAMDRYFMHEGRLCQYAEPLYNH